MLTAREVLAEYGVEAVSIAPLGNGLINLTLQVDGADSTRYVLQRLHRVFTAEVNEALDAVTRHLEAKGLPTPRLIRTTRDKLYVEADGSIWRMLCFVDGRTFDSVPNSTVAREAGALLARFHCALVDLDYVFSGRRGFVHDLGCHLEALRATLMAYRDHRLFRDVKQLSDKIFELSDTIADVLTISDRVIHGDPKISNLMFSSDGARAYCLLDLDTLAYRPLVFELGDAFRSWCNPCGEDTTDTFFSMPLFEAAINGYAEAARGFIRVNEWQSIVAATQSLFAELAARFCIDALRAEYFGWDPKRFGSLGEHNLVRASGQVCAARSLAMQLDQAAAIVEQAFGRDA